MKTTDTAILFDLIQNGGWLEHVPDAEKNDPAIQFAKAKGMYFENEEGKGFLRLGKGARVTMKALYREHMDRAMADEKKWNSTTMREPGAGTGEKPDAP